MYDSRRTSVPLWVAEARRGCSNHPPGLYAFRSDFGERTGRDTRGPQHYFTMRVDQEFLDAVEELRRLQTPIPTKADAIREAVMETLKRAKAGKRAR